MLLPVILWEFASRNWESRQNRSKWNDRGSLTLPWFRIPRATCQVCILRQHIADHPVWVCHLQHVSRWNKITWNNIVLLITVDPHVPIQNTINHSSSPLDCSLNHTPVYMSIYNSHYQYTLRITRVLNISFTSHISVEFPCHIINAHLIQTIHVISCYSIVIE